MAGLKLFLESRVKVCPQTGDKSKRDVFKSVIVKDSKNHSLIKFLADKTPLFYWNFSVLLNDFKDGFFTTPLKQTLERLPTSEHFQSSHFGEISATVFVEDILGLKKIYSKLSLNTTENQNAYKMDLICFIPGSDPTEFVLCEVKSSDKGCDDGYPVGHDKSCYPAIFNSLRDYGEKDLGFDLTAIKDNLKKVSDMDKKLIKESLKPYREIRKNYLGIAVIDKSTFHDDEIEVLCKRKSEKEFDVEVIGIEDYKGVSMGVYKYLDTIRSVL